MNTGLKIRVESQNGKREFQLRFFVDEGVGLLTARDGECYLIRDSVDRWYDMTQKIYPKKRICSCKNDFFELTCRNENQIVEPNKFDLIAMCTSCKKERKITSICIKESCNDELLTLCKQPRIKYKVWQLTSYWSPKDLENFLKFMASCLKMNAYCWYYNQVENKRYFERVDIFKARHIITNHTPLNFYFSDEELDTANFIRIGGCEENSSMSDQEPWRKTEVISLSAPIYMYRIGVVYFIEYCHRYISKGILETKSSRFERKTVLLRSWLKDNFISNRGSNCYDGKDASSRFHVL